MRLLPYCRIIAIMWCTLLITTLLSYNRLAIQYTLLITTLLTYNSYSMYPADYGVRQHLLAMKSNIPE